MFPSSLNVPCVSFLLSILCAPLAPGAEVSIEVPIVFASRAFESGHDPAASEAVVERALEGKLLLWRAPAGPVALVDASASPENPAIPVDVAGPSVSWD